MVVEKSPVFPGFSRSISFQVQSGRTDSDLNNPSAASTSTSPSYHDADAASSSSSLHPTARLLSSINSNRTSARSRTRSVGAEEQHPTISSSFSNRNAKSSLNEPLRGPGTPDITLDDSFKAFKGSPERRSRVLQHGLRTAPRRKRSQTEASSPPVPPSPSTRPKITTQLKSFLTSFRNPSKEDINEGHDDRGTRDGGEQFPRQMPPFQLVMPSARPAAPEGLFGLNTDSPPLTPSSDDLKELPACSTSIEESHVRLPHRHHWTTAQALADGSAHGIPSIPTISEERSFTPSTTSNGISSPTSGSSSPLFGSLSRASSITTYIPSRPNSSIAMLKMSNSSPSQQVGILPSHTITETTRSPSPPEGAATAYRHSTQTSSFTSLMTLRSATMFNSNQLPNLRPHLPALLFLLTAFIGSTMCVLLAISTLPLTLPNHITDLTLNEIREMSLQLQNYSRSSTKSFAHTLAVLGFFFTWKQSFTVPGSLIMNVVFGAMYGTFYGTIFTSVLTAMGGVFCYLLVAPLAPLIRKTPLLNKVLDKMQKAMPVNSIQQARQRSNRDNSSIWTYLLVLRVLPIVPYGLMNIACSVLRVPLVPYGFTLAIGSIPWNACTVQLGDLLVQVVSALDETVNTGATLDNGGFHNVPLSDAGAILSGKVKGKAQSAARAISAKLWNKEMLVKLILMSLISLAPMLLQRWIKRNRSADDNDVDAVDSVDSDYEDSPMIEAKENHWESSEMQSQTSSSWGASWMKCPNNSQSSLPVTNELQRSHSKKLSEAWNIEGASKEERFKAAHRKADSMTQVDIESRRHPSLKRAVAASRLE